jgi:flagellar biosynthesis activator protein FlaF
MYQQSYAEVLEDEQTEARRVEYQALDKVIGLLRQAAAAPNPSRIGVDALHYTWELWSAFVGDLSSDENALPPAVRSNLISVGIWILKETNAIRQGRSRNFSGIADICIIIRDGLR